MIRYYLHCWHSQRTMKRRRAKVRTYTGRSRVGWDIRKAIADLNPLLGKLLLHRERRRQVPLGQTNTSCSGYTA
jgi:hypothetical protein